MVQRNRYPTEKAKHMGRHPKGQSLVRQKKATTGKELVAFFRASPLVGLDIKFERDKSAGRETELRRVDRWSRR